MKKFFALATLCALFTVGFTLTGCTDNTEVEPAEPTEVEPAPMPEPEPMPAPMPADSTMMEADSMGTQM